MKIDISPNVHRALSLQSSLSSRSMRDIADEAISAVIDSRIWDLMGEGEKPQMGKSTSPRVPVVAKVQSKKSTIDKEEIIENAKSYILERLEGGEEPLASEVAAHLGMDARALGPIMKSAGLQAKGTTRKGKAMRIYTLDMIDACRASR